MKKLVALVLTIILLLSSAVSCALAEGRDFLTFVSTYYWALGQLLDDVPYTSVYFLCNLPENENYAVYAINGGQITIDSRTDEIVEFISSSSRIAFNELLISSLVLSFEYEFDELRVPGFPEEFLENNWSGVSDIVNKVYTDGSYESEHYIYNIESSEDLHVIEKDYAAAQQ